jgi:hypothetical protein
MSEAAAAATAAADVHNEANAGDDGVENQQLVGSSTL